jgi:hypothetical protein
MTNNVILRLNRLFKDAGRAISTPSGDTRGHIRRGDFMSCDFTGSARKYLR